MACVVDWLDGFEKTKADVVFCALLTFPKADVFGALLVLPKTGEACTVLALPKILFVDPKAGGEERPNMLVDAVVVAVFVALLPKDGVVLFGWPNVEENPPPKPLFVFDDPNGGGAVVGTTAGDPKILDVAVVVVFTLLFKRFSVLPPKAKPVFDNGLAVTLDPVAPKRFVVGALVVLRFDGIPNAFD